MQLDDAFVPRCVHEQRAMLERLQRELAGADKVLEASVVQALLVAHRC